MTDYLIRRAVEFVKQPREKPFFLYLSHKAVHGPFLPAERHEDLYSDYEVQLPPRHEADSVPTWQAVRTQEWKYIHYLESEGFDELYHLKSDPKELENLVNDPKHEAQLEAMRAQLAKMLRESR